VRFFIKFLFIIWLVSGYLQAQNYLWPTNASPYLSSSFCEYRPGHFHSAIDVKTWNREGYKCFAVADGKIDHIRISPFGGGKALYIRLNDGHIAVYFHLSRFPKRLEREIRKQQLLQKKFAIEWWPKNYSVKKGQLVAFTGQSGIGVPHLHFEIRDSANHPLNPLQFYPQVKDNIAPTLQELLIIPQNERSRAGFSFLPKTIKLIKHKGNRYTLTEPIYARGDIGLAIKGFDRASSVYNKLNFYEARLSLDNKPIFHLAYKQLSFSKTAQADLEVYFPERQITGKQFHKLYIDPYNTLDFYDPTLGNGKIPVGDKIQNFSIEVKDFKGNTSTIKGKIVPFRPRSGTLQQVAKLNTSAFIRLSLPDSLKFIRFSSGQSITKLFPVTYFEIIDRKPNPAGETALIKLTLHSADDYLLQTSYQKGALPPVTSIARLDDQSLLNDTIKTRLINRGKNLVLQIENLDPTANILFKAGDSANFYTRQLTVLNNRAELVIPAHDVPGPWHFYLSQSDSIVLDTLASYYPLFPQKRQSYSFYNDSIQILSDKTPYDSLLFSISRKNAGGEYALPVSGPVYDFGPKDHILKKRIKIRFKADPLFMDGKHTGIYQLNADNHLRYNGGSYDSLTHYITLRSKTFGRFIVAADTVPPLVKMLSPKPDKSYRRFPAIRFSAIDSVSGIGDPENITVYLDDQFIISEWDPERKLVTARPDFSVKKGLHTLRINVRDQSGNQTRRVVDFRIQ